MPKGCPFREICLIYEGKYDPYYANIKSDYKERYCEGCSLEELKQKRLCPIFDLIYTYLKHEKKRQAMEEEASNLALRIAEAISYKNKIVAKN